VPIHQFGTETFLSGEKYDILMEKVEKFNEEPLDRSTMEAAWNNPSDEKAADFYKKRYLK
jgi:thymidylate synthase